jgi:hypothetical protein
MTRNIALPEDLWALRDSLIDRVHANEPIPPEIDKIYKWLAVDGWDELVGEGTNEEMAFVILEFCPGEDELRDFLDLDESDEITDQMKIDYTREKISDATSGNDDCDYPTIAYYSMQGGDGKSAVIGATLSIQQGGWDTEWDGIFLTSEFYIEYLKLAGVWLARDVEDIDDVSILRFWNK